jgi:hypothetical protein
MPRLAYGFGPAFTTTVHERLFAPAAGAVIEGALFGQQATLRAEVSHGQQTQTYQPVGADHVTASVQNVALSQAAGVVIAMALWAQPVRLRRGATLVKDALDIVRTAEPRPQKASVLAA